MKITIPIPDPLLHWFAGVAPSACWRLFYHSLAQRELNPAAMLLLAKVQLLIVGQHLEADEEHAAVDAGQAAVHEALIAATVDDDSLEVITAALYKELAIAWAAACECEAVEDLLETAAEARPPLID